MLFNSRRLPANQWNPMPAVLFSVADVVARAGMTAVGHHDGPPRRISRCRMNWEQQAGPQDKLHDPAVANL